VNCSSSAGRGSARTHLAAAHEHGGRGRGGGDGGRVHLHDSCGSAPGREARNEHCAGGAQLCVAVRTGKRATSVDARLCLCARNARACYMGNSRFSRSKKNFRTRRGAVFNRVNILKYVALVIKGAEADLGDIKCCGPASEWR